MTMRTLGSAWLASSGGLHGEIIYVDPTAELVIVRFASHLLGSNAANDPTLLPAHQAVSEYLMQMP